MEEKNLSKADLYFLALVLSGAVKLDPVEVTKGEDDIGIIYVPGQLTIARNLKLLDELHDEVRSQTEKLSSGEDPLADLQRSLKA